MTTYTPPVFGGNPTDIFPRPYDPNRPDDRYDFRNEYTVDKVPNRKDSKGNVIDNSQVRVITGVIHSLAGGLNRVWGTMRQGSIYRPNSDGDRLARSQLLTEQPGVASLPPKNLSNGSTLAEGYPAASAYFLNRLVISSVGGAGIRATTSTTDATPAAITFVATKISYLATGFANSATSQEYLFVYDEGAACKILSNLTSGGPTVAFTMHANTNPGWGHIRSYLNSANPGAESLLIYANNSIYYYDCTTDPTAAGSFVQVEKAVANGGYPVGLVNLAGTSEYAYWFIPFQNLSHSVCNITDNAGTNLGTLWRCNLDGTDFQRVNLPVRRLLGAVKVDDTTIWLWDGLSVWELTDKARNLQIFRQRYADGLYAQNSNIQFQVGGVCVANGEPYVAVVENDITNSTGNVAFEHLDRRTDTWSRATKAVAPGSFWSQSAGPYMAGNLFESFAPGSMPFDPSTSTMWLTHGAAPADRFFVPPAGVVPFYQLNQTSGAGSTTGMQTVSSGTALSPAFTFEGLEGRKCVIEEVRCMGDIAAGGSDAQWQLDMLNQTSTGFSATGKLTTVFNGAEPMAEMVKRFESNTSYFTRFQYELTLTQGSGSTYKSPNGLPFSYKALCFLDGKVRSPMDVWGY